MGTTECFVCGDPIPDEYGKHDPDAPVFTDDGAYHLRCEDDVFEEVICEVELGDPEYGDRVTYHNGDGNTDFAIVLEPIPDSEYVTVAVADADPRENYIGTGWVVETSVNPHAVCGEEYTATGHAYTPGWE